MNYQKIILVGNATEDARKRTSGKEGVSYTTFGLAVSKNKNRTIFFPVAVFGKLGQVAAKYITKGRQLLVEGEVEIGHNGHFSVLAKRIILGPSTKEPKPTNKTK
jgi:single-stranded DNA-binding protein